MREFTVFNVGKDYHTLQDIFAVKIGCRSITFADAETLGEWVKDYTKDPKKSEQEFENKLRLKNAFENKLCPKNAEESEMIVQSNQPETLADKAPKGSL